MAEMYALHSGYTFERTVVHAPTFEEKRTEFLGLATEIHVREPRQYNKVMQHFLGSRHRERLETLSEKIKPYGNYQLKEAPTVLSFDYEDENASEIAYKFYFSGDYDNFDEHQFRNNLRSMMGYDLDVTIRETKRGSVAVSVVLAGMALNCHSTAGIICLAGGGLGAMTIHSMYPSRHEGAVIASVGAGVGGSVGWATGAGIAAAGAKAGGAAGAAGGPVGMAIGSVVGGLAGWLMSRVG